jgi:hypothetical protein
LYIINVIKIEKEELKMKQKSVSVALFDAEEFLETFGLIASDEMFKVSLAFKDGQCVISTRTVNGVLINDTKIRTIGCSDATGEYVFSYSDFESIIEAITNDLENYGYGYVVLIFNDEKNRLELVRAESRALVIYYDKIN